eukprot:68874-Chlamydomonas_euryale.AAC.4
MGGEGRHSAAEAVCPLVVRTVLLPGKPTTRELRAFGGWKSVGGGAAAACRCGQRSTTEDGLGALPRPAFGLCKGFALDGGSGLQRTLRDRHWAAVTAAGSGPVADSGRQAPRPHPRASARRLETTAYRHVA